MRSIQFPMSNSKFQIFYKVTYYKVHLIDFFSINRERGQTLLEVLVALSAAVIILTAIIGAVTYSLNSSQFSTDQYLASQYAQQGLEVVRRLRDSGWDSFIGLNSTNYCLDKGSSTLRVMAGSCGQNVDLFVRAVTLHHNDAQCSDVSRVIVSVSWADGKCKDPTNPYCHKTDLVSCLSNYNFIPTP